MDLRRYLFEKRIKTNEFAKELGCNYSHLNEIKNGKRKPSLMLAKAIERATDGQVTADELLNPEKE